LKTSDVKRLAKIQIKQILKNVIRKIFDTVPVVKKSVVVVKQKKLELYPQIVQVETTTVCNADCIMCPHSKIKREKGHMDFELYKKIVDDCAENSKSVKNFFPFLNGEFFLTPKWESYLVYARKKLANIEIGIFTNGSLLDMETTKKLLEMEPDWINISFDGTSKETYEQIRRKLNFDQVQNDIIQLVNQRNLSRKKKPRITISIIEMEQTSHRLMSFYKKWARIVDKVTIESYSNWAGKVEDKSAKNPITHRRMACPRLWYNFTILNTGEVVICCLDYNGEIIIGDVKKQSIREIWTGKKITELRNMHLEGRHSKIHLCKDCNYGKHKTEVPIFWC